MTNDRAKQLNFFADHKHVQLVDAPAGRGSATRQHEVITLEWNAPGTRIAASKTDRSVRIWKLGLDRQTLPIVLENLHDKSVESISWDPLVDNILVTVGNDRFVKTWNVITGELVKTIDSTEEKIFNAQYSTDGKYIAAISKSNHVVVIDSLKSVVIQKVKLDSDIYSIAWNNSSSFLFVGLATGSINVYTLKSNELNLLTVLKGHRSSIKSLKFDARANFLLAGSNEGVISIWSLSDLTLHRTIAEIDEPICSVDSSFDGGFIGVTFEDSAALRIYRTDSRKEILQVSKCSAGRQTFPAFKFHPSKPTFAYSTSSGEVFFTLLGGGSNRHYND